jgi:Polyketide cyclase / dehydrase and lipid transport
MTQTPTAQPTPITTTVEIEATPDAVWGVLSDLGRMPEFSPELRKAFVIGKPGVGANIIGINRRKAVVWPTTSKVVRWEPGQAVAWKTRESGATWVYELEATATGTSVTGRRVLPKFTIGTALLGPVIGGAQGHDAELAEGIRTTLERIREAVGAGAGQPDRP